MVVTALLPDKISLEEFLRFPLIAEIASPTDCAEDGSGAGLTSN